MSEGDDSVTTVAVHVSRLCVLVGSRRRQAYRLFDQIRDHVYLPWDVQQGLRLEALRGIIRHAEENCPAYQSLFRKVGLSAAALRSPDELRQMKPVTKRAMRDEMRSFMSRTADSKTYVMKSTSGSSGDPLVFCRDRRYLTAGYAGTMRNMALAGWEPGDAVGYVWGFERGVETAVQDLKGILTRDFYFNAFRQDDALMSQWAGRIRRHRIRFLYGYPNAIELFARFLLKCEVQLPMKAVFCTAEQYLPQQREAIELAFGCRSHNLYGSAEIQNIAYECSEGRMHIASDFVLAQEEIDSPANEPPRLILTSLWNRCLPFIRYELGDYGRVLDGPCPCGIPGETLALIGGKKYDFLRTRNGYLHGAVAGRSFCHVPGIHRYQLIQRGYDHFTARAVLPEGEERGEVRRQMEASVGSTIRKHFGDDVRIEFEYPDSISSSASGKFRFVIQEMNS